MVRKLAGAQLADAELRAEVRAAEEAWDHLFQVMPSACVLTDSSGLILRANHAASRLLNVSAAHLEGRELLLFSQDRQTFLELLRGIDQKRTGEMRAELMLRPRERKPLVTQLHLVTAPNREGAWFWIVTPGTDAPTMDIGGPGWDELTSVREAPANSASRLSSPSANGSSPSFHPR